jgi:hypothetical protein
MNRFLSILLILTVIFATNARAQSTGSDYRTAIGVKVYPGAITLKHFTSDRVALEGLLSFWRYGFRFTGLYEFHADINGAPGLKWYVGPGAHLGFYNDKWGNRFIDDDDERLDLGVDGVIGLDYKIQGAPLNLSLDWQPSFTILSDPEFRSWGGLGVSFTF